MLVLAQDSSDLDRVEINQGTIPAPTHVGGRPYETGAVIPDESWRGLTPSEQGVVVTDVPPRHLGHGIGILRLPPELLEPFRSLQRAAGEARNEQDLSPILSTVETNQGTAVIVAHLRRLFGLGAAVVDDEETSRGVAVRAFGLPTVTVERQTGNLIGLHFDDWHSFRPERRHLSPNRISVNLGCEDRFFVFVNVPLSAMYKEVQRLGSKLPCTGGGTSIGRAFMTLFPSYPVLRLRISPGEGYVAPTENIAHDATSTEMKTMDVSLQVRGRFALLPRAKR